MAISAMVYAAALAVISGHTVSFQHRYALFSMPFLCVAMALGMRSPGFAGMLLGSLSFIVVGATQLHLVRSDDDSAVGPDQYASRAISAVEAYRASPQCEPFLRFRTWNAAVLFNLINWPSQLDRAVQLVDKQEQDFLVVAMKTHCPQQTLRIWARDGRHLRSEPRDPEDAPTESLARP
ncbi:MAG: hypothetical protein IPJ85_11505 [Flavobacteriales bacterium]|nr:hypothetical protein [Flavobacteriales bacterium]